MYSTCAMLYPVARIHEYKKQISTLDTDERHYALNTQENIVNLKFLQSISSRYITYTHDMCDTHFEKSKSPRECNI